MKINIFNQEGYEFISLYNKEGMDIVFCNLGASIYWIKIDGKIMTGTPRDIKEFLSPTCHDGKTLGRVAGRIKDGIINLDGKSYELEHNEGKTCLHGGSKSFSTKKFESKIEKKENYVKITYKYFSEHLEGGFPGNISVSIVYTVFETLDFEIELMADSDMTTLCSLSNHAYFCLGEPSIEDLYLKVPSSKFVTLDKDLIPCEAKDVPTCLDFKKAKRIYKDINDDFLKATNGYDHFLLFDDNKLPIVLTAPKYEMKIYSNYECSVFYTKNSLKGNPTIDSDVITHRSIAIEPEISPLGDRLISKEKPFYRFIRYKFTRR